MECMEQMEEEGTVDGKTDIYAFGRMLEELNDALPKSDRHLRKIAQRCCAYEPANRYDHAASIVWERRRLTPIVLWTTGVLSAAAIMVVNAYLLTREGPNTHDTSEPPAVQVLRDTVHETIHDTIRIVQPMTGGSTAIDVPTKETGRDGRLKELITYAEDVARRKRREAKYNPNWGVEIMDSVRQKTTQLLPPSDPAFHLYLSAANEAAMHIYREYNLEENRRIRDSLRTAEGG